MTVNMKLLGSKRRIAASSLRGRFATNQNGQAAKEKKQNVVAGLDAARTFLASGSGRSVFRLTSPSIGLPGTPRLAQDQRQRHRISIPRWSGRFGCLSEPVLWGLVTLVFAGVRTRPRRAFVRQTHTAWTERRGLACAA